MDPVTRIPGVVYTNGSSIPPGLSGFYTGKTASTKPHATSQPAPFASAHASEPAPTSPSAAAPDERVAGVVYTNGSSIPPGLSGFYTGKTVSTKPHPTSRPLDPAEAGAALVSES